MSDAGGDDPRVKQGGAKTLRAEEIVTHARVDRRTAAQLIAGAIVSAGLAARATPAAAQVTDRDQGRKADPPGRGRGGITDTDTGPNADPPGRGRGSRGGGGSRYTDSDSGPNSDPPGTGRGRSTGITDSDAGPNADPPGRAGGGGVTDVDTGPDADPPARSRGR
jgi:hypothetical protein